MTCNDFELWAVQQKNDFSFEQLQVVWTGTTRLPEKHRKDWTKNHPLIENKP